MGGCLPRSVSDGGWSRGTLSILNKCSGLTKMVNLRAHTETLLLLFNLQPKHSKNCINYMLGQKRTRACKRIILSSAQGLPWIRFLASHVAHAQRRQLG